MRIVPSSLLGQSPPRSFPTHTHVSHSTSGIQSVRAAKATRFASSAPNYDKKTGLYWAYSTDGADDGYYYGIYTSPDLATWSKVPGGALKADGENIWADDWFWAPECYYNVCSVPHLAVT